MGKYIILILLLKLTLITIGQEKKLDILMVKVAGILTANFDMALKKMCCLDTLLLSEDSTFTIDNKLIYLKPELKACFKKGNECLEKKLLKIIKKCDIYRAYDKPIYCSIIVDFNGKITKAFLSGFPNDMVDLDYYFTNEISKLKGWKAGKEDNVEVSSLFVFPIFMSSKHTRIFFKD
jgi:hypothetical protein